ncbi:MAG: hypothetical protein NTW87_10720 [Planctomycetota bacterium]|nr:hypothetical protein [Planctomycetota bacterium]
MKDPGPLRSLRERTEIVEHANIVFSYTHAIQTNKQDIGSAVAIRLGERLFLITAGHILAKGEPFSVFPFRREGPAEEENILNFRFHPDSKSEELHHDIGFIEVENDPLLSACSLDQLEIGEPKPELRRDQSRRYIAGCPESEFSPRGGRGQVGLAMFAANVIEADETTLTLNFETSGFLISPDGSSLQKSDYYPTPKGFSGGGVWAFLMPKKGDVFQPRKHVTMWGTQFSWYPKTRILHATRPRFSMPFFLECYPELRAQYGKVLSAQS